MSRGSLIIRRPTVEKSNTELVTSLQTHFRAAQQSPPPPLTSGSSSPSSTYSSTIATKAAFRRPSFRTWTREQDSVLYIPAIDWSLCGLSEERSRYDITVKLFYLPGI